MSFVDDHGVIRNPAEDLLIPEQHLIAGQENIELGSRLVLSRHATQLVLLNDFSICCVTSILHAVLRTTALLRSLITSKATAATGQHHIFLN